MSQNRFAFGDRVRHRRRPEWGVGSVVRAEDVRLNGSHAQRLSVRFPGAGVKTLNTAQAELDRVVEEPAAATPAEGEAHPVGVWDKVRESEWLAPHAERKIGEAMVSMPPETRDMFLPLRERLEFALRLYRFDRSGRGLIEWSVAQSGLDDPLSRFNRHELEQFFDRWALERDAHLVRLIRESAAEPGLLKSLLPKAPEAARSAVRRLKAG